MVHITSPTFTMQVCICPYLMLCRYYVNRDTLFCYHKASEAFLQRLMALYVASHYKVIVDCSPLTLINLFHPPPPLNLTAAQCPAQCCHFCDSYFCLQNSPNDLQMLSDAPAHHLFCLLPPVPPTQNSLPEVLAVVQVL